MERGAQDEDAGHDDRRLAAEPGQGLLRRERLGRVQREHNEQRDDIAADPLRNQ